VYVGGVEGARNSESSRNVDNTYIYIYANKRESEINNTKRKSVSITRYRFLLSIFRHLIVYAVLARGWARPRLTRCRFRLNI